MRIISRIAFLAILIAITSISPLLAQEDLPSEQIEVVKDFDARLIEAQKVSFRPEQLSIDTTAREYTYNVSAAVPEIEYLAPSIKPLALQTVRIPDYYDGFARVGYGMPNAFLGDLQYEFIRNDELHLGIDLDHSSANNKKIANQRYMDNDASLYGTWYASDLVGVNGEIGYSFDDYYYYAEDPNEPNPDFDKRRYKTFDFNVGAFNPTIVNDKFSYSGQFRFQSHQDDQGVSENNVVFGVSGRSLIGTRHEVSMELKADVTTLDDIDKRNLNNYEVKPAFTFRHDNFKVKGGINVTNGSSNWYFFPVFQGSVQILGESLTGFVGADGGLYKNNFYNLSTYNPYIATRIDDIRNTRNTAFYGGARGKIGILEYEGKFTYQITRDLALFLPDTEDARTFQPIYDDVNISTIDITARARPFGSMEVGISAKKNFYSTTYEEEAWQLPGFEGRVFANYMMFDDQLRLRADFTTLSGLHYIRDDKSIDKLKGIYDISIGADWFFTEHFGVFAHVNNILANKGERWQRYPSYGFNALGGLLVRF